MTWHAGTNLTTTMMTTTTINTEQMTDTRMTHQRLHLELSIVKVAESELPPTALLAVTERQALVVLLVFRTITVELKMVELAQEELEAIEARVTDFLFPDLRISSMSSSSKLT